MRHHFAIKTTRPSPVQSVGTPSDGAWGVGRGMTGTGWSRSLPEGARGCGRGVTMSHLGG